MRACIDLEILSRVFASLAHLGVVIKISNRPDNVGKARFCMPRIFPSFPLIPELVNWYVLLFRFFFTNAIFWVVVDLLQLRSVSLSTCWVGPAYARDTCMDGEGDFNSPIKVTLLSFSY